MHSAALEALQGYLALFPAEQERLAALSAQLAEEHDEVIERSNMRGHITASALVLNHERSHLLLIHHRVLDRWLQPGGHVQAGQTLWASAHREVSEETGVSELEQLILPPLGALPIDIDSHAIPPNPRKGEGPHWHHDFLYLAVAKPHARPEAQLSEVKGVRWSPLAWLRESDDTRLRIVADKISALV